MEGARVKRRGQTPQALYCTVCLIQRARLARQVSAFLFDDKETECVFKRGRVTVMVPAPMHETLLACYHAIFGISDIRPEYLQELNKWSAFERAHLTQGM